MAWLNKFQEGGEVMPQELAQAGGEDQAMQLLVALVQAAMQGDQLAAAQIQQIAQAAQQGDQQAIQLMQAIQQIALQLQGQAQMAHDGAKLSYIHSLRCGNSIVKAKGGTKTGDAEDAEDGETSFYDKVKAAVPYLIDPSLLGGPIYNPALQPVYDKLGILFKKGFDKVRGFARHFKPRGGLHTGFTYDYDDSEEAKLAVAALRAAFEKALKEYGSKPHLIYGEYIRKANPLYPVHDAKGGKVCACKGSKLHKMGGRLVSVDCNGNIIR